MDRLTLYDKILGGGLLAGKKTYLAAGAVAIAAIFSYLSGDMALPELVTRIGEAGGLAGLRSGVSRAAVAE